MKSEEFVTATEQGRTMWRSVVRVLLCAAFFTLHSSLFTSCSEENDTVDEYANWRARNDIYFASLEDSLKANTTQWKKFRNYSLDQNVEGLPNEYIYVKVLSESAGSDDDCAMFTDSVRVSYQGRLIPSVSYPQGYVFEETFYGDYDPKTISAVKFLASGVVDGYATALIHMHKGDRWRVFIPYTLGYNASPKTGIPAYSTLIFDLTLVNFAHAGQEMPAWSARQSSAD